MHNQIFKKVGQLCILCAFLNIEAKVYICFSQVHINSSISQIPSWVGQVHYFVLSTRHFWIFFFFHHISSDRLAKTLLVFGSVAPFHLFNLGLFWVAFHKLLTINWTGVRFVDPLPCTCFKHADGLRSELCDGHFKTLSLSHFAILPKLWSYAWDHC